MVTYLDHACQISQGLTACVCSPPPRKQIEKLGEWDRCTQAINLISSNLLHRLISPFCCFDFSSLGEQGNTVSKSLALKESALSLACTGILETVEVGLVMKLFSIIHRNSVEFIILVHLLLSDFRV